MKRSLLILFVAVFASATTIVPRSVEEMTRDASDVVIGQADQPRAVWNAGHTMIYTLTPFRVERALKGKRSGSITVTQMGGTVDGITTKVAGVRQFQNGERAALFLRPSQDMPGTFVMSSMTQGRFTIELDGTVSNGVSGVHAYDQKSQSFSEYSGSKMTLRELESRVKAAVSK